MWLVYSCVYFRYEGYGLPEIYGLCPSEDAAITYVEQNSSPLNTRYRWSEFMKTREGEVTARTYSNGLHVDGEEWFIEKVEMNP